MMRLSSTRLIVLVALFLVVFVNFRFFTNVFEIYPLDLKNAPFLAALAVLFTCVIVAGLSLLLNRFTLKPVLIGLLMISALSAYFMDSYETVIDATMLRSALETDVGEASDLFSAKLVLYVLVFGLAPALFVYRVEVRYAGFRKETAIRCGLFVASGVAGAAIVLPLGDFYASFVREHKPLRYYANPTYPIYSAAKAVFGSINDRARTVAPIGRDATIPATDVHRELVIMVVGEAGRADRFSLNGYPRKTNPLLEREYVVSYTNFWACAASTTASVPCMFSQLGCDQYTKAKAAARENALDVRSHAGVNVLWLDNNSSSKGVADRLQFVSYRTPATTSPVTRNAGTRACSRICNPT